MFPFILNVNLCSLLNIFSLTILFKFCLNLYSLIKHILSLLLNIFCLTILFKFKFIIKYIFCVMILFKFSDPNNGEP